MFLLFLIIPVVLFYILKLRVNTEITATVFIWQQVLQEQRSKQRWQIRRIISLLLSVLFIVMLSAAVWNPKIHLPAAATAVPKEAQLAITRFTPRRSLDEPFNYEVLAEVSNTGTAAAETILGVQFGDTVISAVPLTVPGNSVKQTVIQGTSPLGGVLLCALIQEKTKNPQIKTPQTNTLQTSTLQTTAILPPVSMQRVFICGEKNIYLESALQSFPGTEVITVKEIPAAISKVIPKETVLVFNGSVPAELPSGSILIFNPQNDTQLFSVSSAGGEPSGISLAAEVDEDSQLVKQLGLTNTFFQRAKNITPKLNADMNVKILAETAEHLPLYLLIETPDSKVLVFNADLNKSGITSQTTFPLLLSRALRYFNQRSKNHFIEDRLIEKDNFYGRESIFPAADKADKKEKTSVWFPLAAACLFWTAAEWFLFLRRKLE